EVLEASFTQSAPSGTDCSGISGVADGGFRSEERRVGKVGGNDLGKYTTSKDSGHKYEDPNGDGDLSDGTGLSGWTIKVYTDVATPVFVTSSTTSDTGAYRYWISDVCYFELEVLEASFTQSAPSGTDCSGISGVADGGF